MFWQDATIPRTVATVRAAKHMFSPASLIGSPGRPHAPPKGTKTGHDSSVQYWTDCRL